MKLTLTLLPRYLSAVLLHDVEICGDDEMPLVITNYEEEINRKSAFPRCLQGLPLKRRRG